MTTNNPTVPCKSSAYSRSKVFRWGVWLLAGATAIMVWQGVRDSMISSKASLLTLEGTVLEERSWEVGGNSSVRLGSGGSAKVQGQATQRSFLKLKSKDGLVKEFEQDEWYPTPKAGWVNQPVRVQYDSGGNLYGIEVAGEVIRKADDTVKYRKIDNKKNQPFMVFLFVVGAPLTLIGWVLSLSGRKAQPKA